MEVLFVLTDYVKGKKIYPAVRRLLNLLFSISITTYLFEHIFFQFTWPDISNYKIILDFFFKGHFIIPLSIFFIVHGVTQFIPSMFITLYNYKKSLILTRKVLEFEIEKTSIEREIETFRAISGSVTPIKINKDMLIEIYYQFKDQLNAEKVSSVQESCEEEKKNLEHNLVFAFRALVATIIYFIAISYFSWVLFLIIIGAIAFYMLLIVIGYRFFDILPTILRKFRLEADKYVSQYLEKKESL